MPRTGNRSRFAVFSLLFPALIALFSPPALAQERAALNRYRTDAPDSLAAAVPVALMKTVTADPERKLPDLVAFLAAGTDDPFLKLKRIHDWIALNIGYDTSVPYGGKPPQQHWAAVLAEKKGVCSGYANLFKKMAELAGLACEAIGGYARGTDYDIFTEGEKASDNHAWNVVTVGDGRFFVDCTWDAGSIEQVGYVPKNSSAFLFIEPEKMIVSHFPADAAFQLLSTPLSQIEFLNQPALKGDFFSYGLAMDTKVQRINTATDRFEFAVGAPVGVILAAVLYERGGMELKNRTLVRKTADGCAVTVLFPRQGEFVVKLFARRADSSKKEYVWCADLGFLSSKGTPDRFPTFFGIYVERGCVLRSPLTGPLRMGDPVTVKITAPGAKTVGAGIRGRVLPFERTGDADTFEKTITVPVARELDILAQFEENASFAGLVRFEVGK